MENVARLKDVVVVAVEVMVEAVVVAVVVVVVVQTKSALDHARIIPLTLHCIALILVTTSSRHHATYLSIMFHACLPT